MPADVKRCCARALGRLRGFFGNKRGNVAMIWALSLVPLSLAAGAGLDYARVIVVRSNLNEALDAAALAVGATSGLNQQGMQQLAQQYFNANYKVDSSYGTPSTLQFPSSQAANSFQITVSDDMPTTILSAVGIHTLPVSVSTTVVWGQTKLWVSLVLDNTGSMCQSDTYPNAGSPCPSPDPGSKIAQLQTATHNLLGMLQNSAANPGDVQVAIIPFVNVVNVGTAEVNAPWLDWTDWNASHGTCNISGYNSQSTCQAANGTWTWTTGHCSNSRYTSKNTCQSHGYTWTWTAGTCNISGQTTQSGCTSTAGTWTPASHTTWNGCVTDRGSDSGPDTTYNFDVENSTPVPGQQTSLFTAVQCQSSGTTVYPQSLMSLSYDWTSLNNKVTAMVATGSTNQPIGLVWGWHAMSQGDPLDAPALPSNTARYIIILSDGLNTQDRWYGNGYSQATQVDDRMADVCYNAKAAGIIIYAVYVDIGGTQGNSSVLQNCATDSSKYFDLTSASQITTALNTIGQQITNLRVLR